AAPLSGRSAGNRGRGPDWCARGHGEEPRPSGPPANAGCAGPAPGDGRRIVMDDVPQAVPGDSATRPEADGVPPDVDLDQVWIGVAAEVWCRRAGWLER